MQRYRVAHTNLPRNQVPEQGVYVLGVDLLRKGHVVATAREMSRHAEVLLDYETRGLLVVQDMGRKGAPIVSLKDVTAPAGGWRCCTLDTAKNCPNHNAGAVEEVSAGDTLILTDSLEVPDVLELGDPAPEALGSDEPSGDAEVRESDGEVDEPVSVDPPEAVEEAPADAPEAEAASTEDDSGNSIEELKSLIVEDLGKSKLKDICELGFDPALDVPRSKKNCVEAIHAALDSGASYDDYAIRELLAE
jgi:hypothetical protein